MLVSNRPETPGGSRHAGAGRNAEFFNKANPAARIPRTPTVSAHSAPPSTVLTDSPRRRACLREKHRGSTRMLPNSKLRTRAMKPMCLRRRPVFDRVLTILSYASVFGVLCDDDDSKKVKLEGGGLRFFVASMRRGVSHWGERYLTTNNQSIHQSINQSINQSSPF